MVVMFLDLGPADKKAIQRRQLVVAQVRQQEEAQRLAKAVSQSKKGKLTNWGYVEHHIDTWNEAN